MTWRPEYNVMSYAGLDRALSRTYSLPRCRFWLGPMVMDLLFEQCDRAGLVDTTWC